MKIYSDKANQADALAKTVADQLAHKIDSDGQAILVVAGGSTPKLFLNSLSRFPLNWKRVTVIPSDERWVKPTDPRSNDRFIRENLAINRACDVTVVSLYVDLKTPGQALVDLEQRLIDLAKSPFVCVLGMGEDGHIASIFPGADNLLAALDHGSNQQVIDIQAPGASEPRISLTLAQIQRASEIHLLISGSSKLNTLESAKLPGQVGDMPVRAILGHASLQIHYTE